MSEKIRFAGLVRVSTEMQGRKGESLRTQKEQIQSFVRSLPNGQVGEVVKWYEGQEHAWGEVRRPILEELLRDADLDIFDAVMVVDVSRWSRDSLEGKIGLKTLVEKGKRFFVGPVEYQLHIPEPAFFVGLFAEVAQLQVSQTARKSVLNKIARAKRGWPACGALPYGRRVTNKQERQTGYAKWEVIPEDQDRVQKLYSLYVEQRMPYAKIELIMGIRRAQVAELLLERRTGGKFVQHFRHKDLNETIETEVPALLTPEQFANVRRVAKSHQQFRKSKRVYSLAHFVRCAHCGQSLKGSAGRDGYVYYVHPTDTRLGRADQCIKCIPAAQLESHVFSAIGEIFRNVGGLRNAVEQYFGSERQAKETLQGQISSLESRIKNRESQVQKLVRAVANGTITDAEAGRLLESLRTEMASLVDERESSVARLALRDAEVPSGVRNYLDQLIFTLTGLRGHAIAAAPAVEQQKIARLFFRERFKDFGVFVSRATDTALGTHYEYTVRGIVGLGRGLFRKTGKGFVAAGDWYEAHADTDRPPPGLIEECETLDFGAFGSGGVRVGANTDVSPLRWRLRKRPSTGFAGTRRRS